MKVKHLVSLKDLDRADLEEVFCLAADIKLNPWKFRGAMAGRTLAMIFEKSSTRTRVSFETAMTRMGGHAIFLSPKDTQLGRGETVPDTARVLSRYVDVIMARVFRHADVATLAKYSRVPVINGLSDFSHPCQALADYFTVLERKGRLQGLTLAYVGDADNNCCHSLLYGGATLGVSVNVACPEGYEPQPAVLRWAEKQGAKTGARFKVVRDPVQAVTGADAVYTDVWTSMGQEAEREKRLKILAPYQVNLKLFKRAAKDALFLHCLPAHRGEEVTDDVADHERSAIFDEAENRMHVQAAVMLLLVEAHELA
jgi:ornithine carbamoyltransferase